MKLDVQYCCVMAAHASMSCLTSTKGILDRRTLPRIRETALERLQAERMVVIMNDFIDGATTDTAVEWSGRRLALQISGLGMLWR
jgi:hypothetical protein